MTGFTSLLSSIGGQSKSSQAQKSEARALSRAQDRSGAPSQSRDTQLVPNNAVAGVKRRSGEISPVSNTRTGKIAPNSAKLATSRSNSGGALLTKTAPSPSSNPYRGTARSTISTTSNKPGSKASLTTSIKANVPTTSATVAAVPKGQKRGFASIMEKAKAAQEAAKASGSNGIKHKPVERLTMRDRQRQKEEAQQRVRENSSAKANNRNKVTPVAGGSATPKKGQPETTYKGTMKKAPAPLAYKGTMRALGSGVDRSKVVAKKGLGQDKYGGYASWSDLDDAEDEEEEDEEEEDHHSDGSSDMEAGWGDTEREEVNALRYAKQEDQEAMQEEDRHRREKLERKRRLQELSKSSAAKRKY